MLMLVLWLQGCSWFGGNVAQKPAQGQNSQAQPRPAAPGTTQNQAVPRLQNQPWQSGAGATAPVPTATSPAIKAKVAILLPLSGRNAGLGQAMLNAAQQAVFDAADDKFQLMPRDTGDNGADNAARDAVASGAQFLIGPLFATDVPAVRGVAESANLSMLTLSTDTTLAARGVYVMGFAPGAQVERVVSYAIEHGLHRFAGLVPNTAYGSLVGAAFQDAVTRHGGTLVGYEAYDAARHDSDAHIQALAKVRDQIDALFLPAGGMELAAAANQVAAAGFDAKRVRLLGTGLWDAPDLARQSAFLIGGWYAAPDPAGRRGFIRTYVTTYGQEPPRLATLAYDATALAAVLGKRGARYDETALTNPNGFAGLDGIFRLTPSGLVERGLAVDEVGADGGHVIEAAPASFAGR